MIDWKKLTYQEAEKQAQEESERTRLKFMSQYDILEQYKRLKKNELVGQDFLEQHELLLESYALIEKKQCELLILDEYALPEEYRSLSKAEILDQYKLLKKKNDERLKEVPYFFSLEEGLLKNRSEAAKQAQKEANSTYLKCMRKYRLANNIPFDKEVFEKRKKEFKTFVNGIKINNKISGRKIDVINPDFKLDNPENRPVIVVFNHIGKFDLEMLGEYLNDYLDMHCCILSGDARNLYGTFNGKLLDKNGVTYIDLDDREDCCNGSVEVIQHLRNGVDYVVSAEGIHNFSPNALHLPIYKGAPVMGKESDALILVVGIHQENKKGTKIFPIKAGAVIDMRNLTVAEGIATLEENMSTVMMDIHEYKHGYKHEDNPENQYSAHNRKQERAYKHNKGRPLKRVEINHSYWDETVKRNKRDWCFSDAYIGRHTRTRKNESTLHNKRDEYALVNEPFILPPDEIMREANYYAEKHLSFVVNDEIAKILSLTKTNQKK